MDNSKSVPTDTDVFASRIQLLAGKTKADPHPEELESLKKLIKKNVPFTLRGYFLAYVVRELLSQENSKTGNRSRQHQQRNNGNNGAKPRLSAAAGNTTPTSQAQNGTDATAKVARPERKEKALPEGAKTLYLNIGKIRKLYAREISQMLQENLSITRDDIYAIRVHDKYSFITMDEANCEKAIALFNGKEIKGRTAQVTYSNKG
ncbi:MAG: DbpA RNA binding domain-containing protein [Spirochaetia bacterium]|jgi:hypothetical protein|nr:DbpA RNA binding domain-containing protein [Spirochaetia bacterium]